MSRTEDQVKVRLRASAAWEHLSRHNFSQNELARRLGITSGYLSQLITGKRSPSAEMRRRILALLPGTTFDELFVVQEAEPLNGAAPVAAVEGRR
jgi:transcriptional regulator with XRE-family HTH domain